MIKRTVKSKAVTLLLTGVFSLAAFQAPVHAALYTTDQVAGYAQRQALSDQLLREDVKQELMRLGVNPIDVQQRINQLTPGELSRIQGQLDSLPAGSGALGTIAVILLILILLDIAGVTDIFPGV